MPASSHKSWGTCRPHLGTLLPRIGCCQGRGETRCWRRPSTLQHLFLLSCPHGCRPLAEGSLCSLAVPTWTPCRPPFLPPLHLQWTMQPPTCCATVGRPIPGLRPLLSRLSSDRSLAAHWLCDQDPALSISGLHTSTSVNGGVSVCLLKSEVYAGWPEDLTSLEMTYLLRKRPHKRSKVTIGLQVGPAGKANLMKESIFAMDVSVLLTPSPHSPRVWCPSAQGAHEPQSPFPPSGRYCLCVNHQMFIIALSSFLRKLTCFRQTAGWSLSLHPQES